ncbi:hypothetical protein [Streptomyces cirratus]|uniref:hypothetical protein n=1 Tax=Streptomyces cirratus TaxID=68187 RepID=UPI0036236BFC
MLLGEDERETSCGRGAAGPHEGVRGLRQAVRPVLGDRPCLGDGGAGGCDAADRAAPVIGVRAEEEVLADGGRDFVEDRPSGTGQHGTDLWLPESLGVLVVAARLARSGLLAGDESGFDEQGVEVGDASQELVDGDRVAGLHAALPSGACGNTGSGQAQADSALGRSASRAAANTAAASFRRAK